MVYYNQHMMQRGSVFHAAFSRRKQMAKAIDKDFLRYHQLQRAATLQLTHRLHYRCMWQHVL
jgi:hypothetical protein